jgi:hypothetical protein
MEAYIKYKRITKIVKESETQKFFDDLVIDGWDIIYYNERMLFNLVDEILITMVLGRRQERKL